MKKTTVILLSVILFTCTSCQFSNAIRIGTSQSYFSGKYSENGDYSATMETEDMSTYVNINYKGQCVLNKKIDHTVNQIVVGDLGFYLFSKNIFLPDEDKEATSFVEYYDFAGNMQKRYIDNELTAIAFKQNKVFFLNEGHEDENDTEIVEMFNFSGFGFNADSFIEESNFGKTPKKIKGNIDYKKYGLQEHKGYFTTAMNDSVHNIDQILSNCARDNEKYYKELLSKLGLDSFDDIEFFQYQNGNYIYGVCSQLDGHIDVNPYFSEEFKVGYAYRYDLQKKEFEVFHEERNAMYLACSENTIVYLYDNALYTENLDGSHKKRLGEIKSPQTGIYIQGKHILLDSVKEKVRVYRWSE